VMDEAIAVMTVLQVKTAMPSGIPEPGGLLGLRGKETLRAALGAFVNSHSVASVPRMIVDMADRTPPLPWANATSAPST